MLRFVLRSLGFLFAALPFSRGPVCSSDSGVVAVPNPEVDNPLAVTKGEETAVIAGGCFWGIQAVFQHLKGVIRATSGYSGGSAKMANYEAVCSGRSGHAEAVEIVFDPSKISYGQVLRIFFSVAHNPTELNRQGPDVGTQYRSAIFFTNDAQKRIAQSFIDQLNQAKVYSRPIVTQVAPLDAFYPAEEYHQDYAEQNPENMYIVVNDLPKVANLRRTYPELYIERK
jgi:peptide-methionine (S)-S-oxide reductase